MDSCVVVVIVGTRDKVCQAPRDTGSTGHQKVFAVTISCLSLLVAPGLSLAGLHRLVHQDPFAELPVSSRICFWHSPAGENSCLWCRVAVMIQTLLYPKQIANVSSMEKRIHHKMECFLKGLGDFLSYSQSCF